MADDLRCSGGASGIAPQILFVAGDVSGDLNTALLAKRIRALHPDWSLHALGGAALRAAVGGSPGSVIVGDTTGCGVIGFTSALALWPRIIELRRKLLHFVRSAKIDVAVLCDWGAVNGRLLPHLKALGIPSLYYCPPRSWQKHGAGGLGIVPFVTRVATPFEWSAHKLRAAGCQVEWVGHPLLETVRRDVDRDALRAGFGVHGDTRMVAVLPGSRALELRCIAPHLADAAAALAGPAEGRGDVTCFVAAAPGTAGVVRKYFADTTRVVEGRTTDLLLACDIALVKSGTSTLEAAVADAPAIVVYDVPPLLRAQWRLTGMAKKTPFVAMPNIILEKEVMPELLGDRCRAPVIVRHALELLEDAPRRAAMREDYCRIRKALGSDLAMGATEHTARMLEEMAGATL